MDLLEFDSAEVIQIPVRIGDKWYCLQEADEETASEYQGAMLKGIDLDLTKILSGDGTTLDLKEAIKSVDLTKMMSSGAELLSKCLREADYNKEQEKFISIGELVSLSTIKGWKSTVTAPIIKKLITISELNKGAANPLLPVEQKSTTGG